MAQRPVDNFQAKMETKLKQENDFRTSPPESVDVVMHRFTNVRLQQLRAHTQYLADPPPDIT